MMRREKQISRDFYRHAETGEIFVVERRWDGTILGSCPAAEPLMDLGKYTCTDTNNIWLAENSDNMILYGEQKPQGDSD
jgi:hypothetical protein